MFLGNSWDLMVIFDGNVLGIQWNFHENFSSNPPFIHIKHALETHGKKSRMTPDSPDIWDILDHPMRLTLQCPHGKIPLEDDGGCWENHWN
jgi:hypothetical protein